MGKYSKHIGDRDISFHDVTSKRYDGARVIWQQTKKELPRQFLFHIVLLIFNCFGERFGFFPVRVQEYVVLRNGISSAFAV